MKKLISTLFFLPLLLSCQDKQVIEELQKYRQAEATEKANIEIVKEFYMLLDDQDLVTCQKLCTRDMKGYMGSSEKATTFTEIIPFIKMYYTAFPDYKHQTEVIFAQGDYVATLQKYTGTHTHTFMGLEPTGNKIEYKGIFIFKITDGKVAALWGIEDDFTFWRNLGITLPPDE